MRAAQRAARRLPCAGRIEGRGAPARSTATLTLGTQQFLGQFVSDFNAVLAALTIAIIPMLVLYIVFNRQFIRGLMGGALK